MHWTWNKTTNSKTKIISVLLIQTRLFEKKSKHFSFSELFRVETELAEALAQFAAEAARGSLEFAGI
jgi:hypothetical protein